MTGRPTLSDPPNEAHALAASGGLLLRGAGTFPYETLIFDCDGVVLNSNRLKTEAFRQAALPYGQDVAEALVEYHVAHGGVSRYRKFDHFLAEIVPMERVGPGLDELLSRYAAAVREGLRTCEVAPGLAELRAATPDARWLIVSGGDQAELRAIFSHRGLSDLFDGGIFGSPDSKETILSRETDTGTIRKPALFVGDSRYDHRAAIAAGCDFLFVSGWSDMNDWHGYVRENGLTSVRSVREITQLI